MARKDAREAAMKLIYQREIAGDPDYDTEALGEMKEELSLGERDVKYISDVLEGVKEHQEEIDRYIKQYARGWNFHRIAKIDLAILRLALFEILYREDIPISVSINEGVELAKKYGSDKSSSFINGILGNIVRSLEVEKKEL